MFKWRVRVDDRQATPYQPLGNFTQVNLRDGWRSAPGVLNANYGLGKYSICFDELHQGPPFNEGGPLLIYHHTDPNYIAGGGTVLSRQLAYPPPGIAPVAGDDWRLEYSGGFLPFHDTWANGSRIEISDPATFVQPTLSPSDLSELGARAYTRMRPKVEKAGVMQALVEFRDAPRMLQTTSKAFVTAWKAMGGSTRGRQWRTLRSWRQLPRSLSDQFINVQFGWKPFVKDVVDVCDVVVNFDEYSASLKRRNDRFIQRRFAEDDIVTEQVFDPVESNSGTTYCNPLLGVDFVNTSKRSFTVRTIVRQWYAGSFKIYLPEFDTMERNGFDEVRTVRQYMTLLGIEVNPVTLWKVMPWSWCADWFVNVGDNVRVFNDMLSNTVASKYMYLMRHAVIQVEFTSEFKSWDGQTYRFSSMVEHVVKRRVPAESNFGFSAVPGQLSGMQSAILSALGIALIHPR